MGSPTSISDGGQTSRSRVRHSSQTTHDSPAELAETDAELELAELELADLGWGWGRPGSDYQIGLIGGHPERVNYLLNPLVDLPKIF